MSAKWHTPVEVENLVHQSARLLSNFGVGAAAAAAGLATEQGPFPIAKVCTDEGAVLHASKCSPAAAGHTESTELGILRFVPAIARALRAHGPAACQ